MGAQVGSEQRSDTGCFARPSRQDRRRTAGGSLRVMQQLHGRWPWPPLPAAPAPPLKPPIHFPIAFLFAAGGHMGREFIDTGTVARPFRFGQPVAAINSPVWLRNNSPVSLPPAGYQTHDGQGNVPTGAQWEKGTGVWHACHGAVVRTKDVHSLAMRLTLLLFRMLQGTTSTGR